MTEFSMLRIFLGCLRKPKPTSLTEVFVDPKPRPGRYQPIRTMRLLSNKKGDKAVAARDLTSYLSVIFIVDMKKSQLIKEIIISSGLAASLSEASGIFAQTFVEYFFGWDLEKWDTEIPHDRAEMFKRKIGSGRGISVRYLIKDLDFVTKR